MKLFETYVEMECLSQDVNSTTTFAVNKAMFHKLSNASYFIDSTIFIKYNMKDASEFDTAIYRFVHITDLLLMHLESDSIKIDYQKFPFLTYLTISESNIPVVFKNYYSCGSVKQISFVNCKIDTIKDGVLGFYNLIDFECSRTSDIVFDFLFSDFSNLEVLGLDYRSSRIPPGICFCRNLKALLLSINKKVPIPDCLNSLKINYKLIGRFEDSSTPSKTSL
ncbi:MAG: hypothetical protein CVU11_16570 [Bacteroidetes bacterium HGW-Bacteroidetes-6]|jgi:hypothetical protein|nr:MAG: hypothetical protein CVU11_16570 [Bacteroidetes bacterium HGW-Bacteroidetes-6]